MSVPAKLSKYVRQVAALRRRVAQASTVEEAMQCLAMADTIEEAMCEAGYRKDTTVIRPANEARFEARWRLGQLLAAIDRRSGHGVTSRYSKILKDLGLNRVRANECERIGAIPREKLAKAFVETEREGVLNTVASMFLFARPFWKIKVRSRRHRAIRESAVVSRAPEKFGPFTVLYADPPTHFETYTAGSYRGPNQHYPTLSWDEINNFAIYGKHVSQIAHDNAVLFLWCTSSNLERGLDIMRAWGFAFKTSAIWDKGKQGTGLIFRNMHEVLLFGDRGEMPGPVYLPPSIFRYPRGKHSAKPPEIRSEIERMYPDYNADTRLELFSRDSVPGWTHLGFEANAAEAAE
jgi:N6-adenosine-specific RNA methylase IME4